MENNLDKILFNNIIDFIYKLFWRPEKTMWRKRVIAYASMYILTFSSFLWADGIVNPGFELAVQGEDFNTPVGWNVENYTVVVGHFIPHPEPGETTNWRIDPTIGLFPFEGEHFLVLSNDDMPDQVLYSKVWQQVAIAAGKKISGAYFFGTCDYVPYDDYGQIKLVAPSGSGLSDIELVNISTSDVESFSSTDGWVTFESAPFTAATAGTYTLECSVYNYGDAVWDSYLAVDGLAIIPEPASIMLLIVGAFISLRQKPKQSQNG